MNTLISKLKEPSTIKGLMMAAGLMGYGFNQDLAEPIALTVGGIISLYEIIRNQGYAAK